MKILAGFQPTKILALALAERSRRNCALLRSTIYGFLGRKATSAIAASGHSGFALMRTKEAAIAAVFVLISACLFLMARRFRHILQAPVASASRVDSAEDSAVIALTGTTEHLRQLVESVRDHALFTIDLTGHVTSWNHGAERLLGYSEAEVAGRSFSCFFTPEDIRMGTPAMQISKAKQEGQAGDEGWRVRANGERFWADVNQTVLLENDHVVRGFAVIMHDVTERRKAAIALEEARQDRERLQDRFLSHVSHELRTPLAAIYFFLTNVLDGLFGELTPDQRENLLLALDNSKQLKYMVGDLLESTRAEADRFSVACQPVSPPKLVSQVFSTCRANAAAKNIGLCSELAPDTPYLWADPSRVRQILVNLIDNAIKYTPEGGAVTVGNPLFGEDRQFLCLSVSDTGCGISPENCELIFDRLSQVKSATEASRNGLGLGLFVVRELVLRHGGRIWVDSQLGQGSSFYFTLPLFSLADWCGRVLIAPNPEACHLTLIAVDLLAVGGGLPEEAIDETRRALERCVPPGPNVVLPSLSAAENAETFFIVACAGPGGCDAIKTRIKRELQNCVHISEFEPVISSTGVPLIRSNSWEDRKKQTAEQIEDLMKTHCEAIPGAHLPLLTSSSSAHGQGA